MGGLFSSISRQPTKHRLLMQGLDAAGKTTILYQLKLGELIRTIPTIGFNVETVQLHGLELTVWDVGGGTRIRELWRHYYEESSGIIFVLDGTDPERWLTPDFVDELDRIFREPLLEHVPILFLMNKSDLKPKFKITQKITNNCEITTTVNQIYDTTSDDYINCQYDPVQEFAKLLAEYRGSGGLFFDHLYAIFPCSAVTRDGLSGALEWLSETLQ